MTETLQDLRSSIDGIDRKIHSLLIERAGVVAAIGKIKAQEAGNSSQNNLRLDRECEIIRTRIREHKGQFPADSLIRIWREIISASLRIEGSFTVAVRARKSFASFPFLKNVYDYFGSYTDIRIYNSAISAIAAVRKNTATVAVLPLNDGDKPWWLRDIKLKIALRLPAVRKKNDVSADAFVLTGGDYHPSENDISVLKVFSSLTASGIKSSFVSCGMTGAVCENCRCTKDSSRRLYLYTVPGYVVSDDAGIRKLEKMTGIDKVEVLGWYPLMK